MWGLGTVFQEEGNKVLKLKWAWFIQETARRERIIGRKVKVFFQNSHENLGASQVSHYDALKNQPGHYHNQYQQQKQTISKTGTNKVDSKTWSREAKKKENNYLVKEDSIKLNYDLGWSEFWLKEHLILSNFQVSYLVQRRFLKNLIVSGWTQLNILSLEGRIKSSLGSQPLHYRVGCLELSVYLEVSRLWRAELF